VLTPGEDLEIYGVEQLAERIAVLKDELARTEAMLAKKKTGLAPRIPCLRNRNHGGTWPRPCSPKAICHAVRQV
jgi:hypothetical protein